MTVLRYHFSGVAGAGMGPLACLMRSRGHAVQGSDRAFDLGKKQDSAAPLRRLGIEIVPQDGRAITAAINRLVYSAAVEADTPELRAARALNIPCLPRPQLLAEVLEAASPSVAIAGTSGKSTIVGMIGWLLREGGVPATVLGGADFAGEGVGGCFVGGPADGPAVAEACESDGTLVGYRPTIGVVHNVSRDHDELSRASPAVHGLRPELRPASGRRRLSGGDRARTALQGGELRAVGRRRRATAGHQRRAEACPGRATTRRPRHHPGSPAARPAQPPERHRRGAGGGRARPRRGDRGEPARAVPGRRPPLRGDRHDARHPGRRRLRAQRREAPRGHLLGPGGRRARRRRLPASRLRPGAVPARASYAP